MGFTVDIDTGGTFTDGFITRGDAFRSVKTPTTPHDLTLCFMACIEEAARAFGLPLQDFLFETDIIRFANTIGTNSIIQRDGAKVGLILTAGHAALAPSVDADGKAPLVAADMVAEIGEEVDANGNGRRMPDAGQVMEAAQRLIDRGARCLVVALEHADLNPAHEQAVRAIVKREYPRDYLGSVPVFLSSDIVQRSGYRERINTAVLNAYIHGKLTRLLYKAGEDLRRRHYRGQLLIGHNNGAVARVAKTRAINTYNSGPAAGLLGAREIGALYGSGCVISGDMGGTSFDIGCVLEGEPGYALRPDVEGFDCNLPMLEIRALGAGGGSIASIADGRLRVGPQSAGALPGPACFGLGGTQPTVTDANLVLGWLDPDYFLGGNRRLDVDKARAAIARHVAEPLGIGVEEAAWRIRETLEGDVGRELARVRDRMGPHPDPLLVVYGGAGPLHSCAISAIAGIERIVITPFSAVFSAYSSSLMDVGHLYHQRVDLVLAPGQEIAPLREALERLRRRGEADMRGEGFEAGGISWMLESIVEDGAGGEARLSAAIELLAGADAVEALRQRAVAALGMSADGHPRLTALGLFARSAVPHFRQAVHGLATTTAIAALRGERSVYLGPDEGCRALPLYARNRLLPGHVLEGPAIVESDQTTMVVPAGWRLCVDQYDNALIERSRES